MRTPIHFENNQKKRRCLISILIPLAPEDFGECREIPAKPKNHNTLDFISIVISSSFFLFNRIFFFSSTSNFFFPSVQYIIERTSRSYMSLLFVLWWIISTLNSQTLHKEASYSRSRNRPSRLIYKTWIIWFNTINHHLHGLPKPSRVFLHMIAQLVNLSPYNVHLQSPTLPRFIRTIINLRILHL